MNGRLDSFGEAFTEMRNSLEGLNRMRFSGYIQPQYVNDERSRNELGGSTGTRNLDQFSVRRARVKFTYQFSPTSRFVLQPDVTSSGVSLKDGYAEFTEPWTAWKNTLTAGQFNWPFGFEIMYSSSSREMPERSRVIRTLFPGERDRGVMLSGLGFGERFRYQVAVVNGTGTSRSDDVNKRKDVVGRVGYSLGPFDIGASLYRGSDIVATSTVATGVEFD
ncbi:MAG TPA: porin, partial [Thermoanaerobaculia bacterium]|nr:porin [Thermoanaerobaculia bacterium]